MSVESLYNMSYYVHHTDLSASLSSKKQKLLGSPDHSCSQMAQQPAPSSGLTYRTHLRKQPSNLHASRIIKSSMSSQFQCLNMTSDSSPNSILLHLVCARAPHSSNEESPPSNVITRHELILAESIILSSLMLYTVLLFIFRSHR